uniref:Uncharacterized protein n=1 Tax=viral metagenome TaxID=1070528 RepID=A0A6C0B2F9_9ZZZZ
MENIYETNDSFQFDKLNLLKPVSSAGGNYFIRFTIDGNYLYIQPPKCKTKQGIVKAGKKYYTDLMFSNANDQFVRWMENLETYCHQFIFKNREQWFEGDMEMHDIENYFTSPMKVFKSGTYYIVRTNVPSALGKPTLKIYDEFENEVSLDSINEHTDIMNIIEIQGIKCSAKSFQIELEIKQMMVFKPVKLFERCIIKTSDPKTSENKKMIIEHEDEQAVIALVPDSVEQLLTEEPVLTKLEEVEDEDEVEKPVETTLEHLVEQEDNFTVDVNESIETLELLPKTNDIEEIDFPLDTLSEEDTIQIKKRNDVYYEMYRDARKKAKIAKDLALSSYLEAKRIKNTYMLNDIIDSDSSDLEDLEAEDE